MTYKYDCHYPDKPFKWNKKRGMVALDLALGYTQQATAEKFKIDKKTIVRWKAHPEFQQEVDRLSFMIFTSSQAERLRIAMRVVREKIAEEKIETNRDLLDWLKFIQSETDGAKLNITTLFENALALAGAGPDGGGEADRGAEPTAETVAE